MEYSNKEKSGIYNAFTVIETLVVIGLLMGISLIAYSMSIPQLKSTNSMQEIEKLQKQLFVNQQRAFSGYKDKSYGIHFENNKYTIFTGDSYATADSKEDITFVKVSISNMNLSGGNNDIIFLKGSIKPTSFGTITLSDSVKNYQIVVNQEGFIEIIK